MAIQLQQYDDLYPGSGPCHIRNLIIVVSYVQLTSGVRKVQNLFEFALVSADGKQPSLQVGPKQYPSPDY